MTHHVHACARTQPTLLVFPPRNLTVELMESLEVTIPGSEVQTVMFSKSDTLCIFSYGLHV